MVVSIDYHKELSKAKEDYELAMQQESNADPEFIDIAILNTNAAKVKLDNAIKCIKMLHKA